MASTAAAPTTELGSPNQFGTWSTPTLEQRETVRDLAYPRSVRITYPGMLNDAQIDGLYRGATMPIRAYHWWLDPNGAPPATVERISTNYGLPVGKDGVMNRRRTQGRFRWDRHLEDALRMIVLGHYAFEQVGDIGPDGLWHIRKLAPRPPRTILEIKPARDGGLDYIRVPALATGTSPTYSLARGVELPVSRLLMYVWDQEGGNWTGRSMLRSSYRPWKLKDRVVRVGAINIDRAGGVPYIEAPDGATSKDMADLHQLAAAFRVGEDAGAALPHGAVLKFAQAAGGDQAVNFVRLQNEEMARAWLMMFLQSGQTSSGHGSTQQVGEQIDYFGEVQRAIATQIADVFNEHQIEDDVEWNEGDLAQYAPLVRFTPHNDSLDVLAGELDNAQTAGALPAGSQVAAAVKREASPRWRRPAAAATATAPADPVEASGMDARGLQDAFATAHQAMVEAWNTLQAGIVDDLVAQVAAAASVTTVASLAAGAVTGAALMDALATLLEHGASTAVDEAAHQGVTITAPDLTDVTAAASDAADATVTILATSLAQSAASRAVGLWGADADPVSIADQVRQHLESLAGATADYEMAGLATQTQNEGRFATWANDDQPGDYYASSVNDTNTCEPCRMENDTDFPSLAEARRDFPAGQFLGCQGGKRCRCAVVKVYAETPGQA